MGRPRTFDEGEALDRAMHVFWKQGYQATSTDDLMEAMGIGRGSFYNAFGSKRDVYLQTLDRYAAMLKERGGPYRTPLEVQPGVEALEAMLTGYLESLMDRDGPCGCYFAHVAKEHRGDDPEVQAAIRRGMSAMRGVIGSHLDAAKADGIISTRIDTDSLAVMMMSVAWGSHVLIEAGMDVESARTAAQTMFRMAAVDRSEGAPASA